MDLKGLVNLLADCSEGLLIFGLVAGIYFFSKLDSIRKFIVFYIALLLITELLSYYVGMTFGSNHMIFPLYCLFELALFIYLYIKYLFKKRHMFTTVLGTLGIGFILYEFIYNFIYHQVSPEEYQPYAKVVDNFVIIIFSLTYLLEKMTTYNESRWDNFSFNIGVLINFTISTIFYLPFNFLVNETSGLKYYFWISNLFLLHAFYVFLIIEMYKNARKNPRLAQAR
ncbi:hypothetical protein ACLI09_17745 [Flavobacterium sp. RHBU_24]|uniref:hypothetical protein n=1 Tax=Flavobacterium sp. RHBU_24 TaxID=3391185 RepID=UPI0039851529